MLVRQSNAACYFSLPFPLSLHKGMEHIGGGGCANRNYLLLHSSSSSADISGIFELVENRSRFLLASATWEKRRGVFLLCVCLQWAVIQGEG